MVTFSPDGRKLLTASQDDTAAIWDFTAGTARRKIVLQHDAALYSARFSPDGRRAVTACLDQTARVWDATTGQPLSSPMPHNAPVQDAAFSGDGNWIATASGRSAWIWPSPQSGLSAPDWLSELAEAVAGVKQTVESSSDIVLPTQLLELLQRLRVSPEARTEHRWLDWFLEDPANRPVAPEASFTVPQLLAAEEANAHWGEVSSASLIESLLVLQPTNGWLYSQAARLVLDEYDRRSDPRRLREAEWLTDRALGLDPNHPAIWWTRARHLGYVGDQPGTWEAIERAERLPDASARVFLSGAEWLDEQWQRKQCRPEAVLAAYRRAIDGPPSSAKLNALRLRTAWLNSAGIEATTGDREAARAARYRAYELTLPPRAPDTPARLIDLSDFYTASPDGDWRASRFPGHDLSGLPRGRQVFEGIEYDVRGMVQLSSTYLQGKGLQYPEAVRNIPVQQSCRRIHFLHAADNTVAEEATVARYVVRWTDERVELLPIRFGIEAWPWDFEPWANKPRATVAWRGTNPAGQPVRLYRTTWTNSHPEVPVASIDLLSDMTRCGMFVVAITVE
jgi:hypothetical protein